MRDGKDTVNTVITIKFKQNCVAMDYVLALIITHTLTLTYQL